MMVPVSRGIHGARNYSMIKIDGSVAVDMLSICYVHRYKSRLTDEGAATVRSARHLPRDWKTQRASNMPICPMSDRTRPTYRTVI